MLVPNTRSLSKTRTLMAIAGSLVLQACGAPTSTGGSGEAGAVPSAVVSTGTGGWAATSVSTTTTSASPSSGASGEDGGAGGGETGGGGAGGGTECVGDPDCPPDEDCLDRSCRAGVCTSVALIGGEPCLVSPFGFCNVQGYCGECYDASDCPPWDECGDSTCALDTCVLDPDPPGTPCAAGFCLSGLCRECIDDSHCPEEDCAFAGTCQSLACVSQAVPAGHPCNLTPGGICDASQTCQVCATSCPIPGVCEHLVCSQGVCEVAPAPANTPCAAGYCDGAGNCVGCTDSFQCPGFDHFNGPGPACEYSVCELGACVFYDKSDGIACGNFSDGQACINGTCTGCLASLACPGNFVCCGAPTYTCAPTVGQCP